MKILLTIISVICLLTSFCQATKTTWGMIPEEVKKIEHAKLILEDQNKLTFFTNQDDGRQCEIIYKFNSNKLAEIVYRYRPNNKVAEKPKNSDIIWNKTIKELEAQYGLPSQKDNKKHKVWTWSSNDSSIKASHVPGKYLETVYVSIIPQKGT